MAGRGLLIGIDVGGTFTDAIVLSGADGCLLTAFKVPSEPDDAARAVLEAINRIGAQFGLPNSIVCHGTTVGTNVLIQRQGAKTALVTTRGFADVIELRRQARPRLYDFRVQISEPLVPSSRRFEVSERLDPDGNVVEELEDLGKLISALLAAEVEAVAISFLNSYANEAHEVRVAEELRAALPDVFVSRSSDVCPEFGEYERTSTAVVDAYIGPAVSRYIEDLRCQLSDQRVSRLMVVKSNGGLTSAQNAARYPVHLIESGPAAGLMAAASFAKAIGRTNVIAFDMGGTTAKAGIIQNGEPRTTGEFYADRLRDGNDTGGYAIRSAILQLDEIGAGGGSIAWLDGAGVIKVGPVSAGSSPGPACYARGGQLPTVTDAHAIIGTLRKETFVDSGVNFDRSLAEAAIGCHIAQPLGWSLARAAYAIVDLAVAAMAQMVRLATVQRGLDPRDFSLVASGGAGPLHGSLIARHIGIQEVIVPPFPGMFSALGSTLGLIRHELVRTILNSLAEVSANDLERAFAELTDRAGVLLAGEPAGVVPPVYQHFADARFVGQLFELRVPLTQDELLSPAAIETAFRQAYYDEYGILLSDANVQLVNLRILVSVDLGSQATALFSATDEKPAQLQPARTTPILSREGIEEHVPSINAAEGAGQIWGPCIIEHSGSTVWVQHGQHAVIDTGGRVLIRLDKEF